MTPADLLERLRRLGVELSCNGDTLHVEASAGTVTEELLQELRAHKAEIIRFLLQDPPQSRVIFVENVPVVLGPNGEDPLDFRFDTVRKAWVHDPGWWLSIPRRGGKQSEAQD
ncbi:MAG: hypothetical protein HPY71_03845 [Firmicutes bacterium]|nr:hypothetical protein [Bacillota bacterium]